jgi:hypothetical protein
MDPIQIERKDTDLHHSQSDKLDPDPDPHESDNPHPDPHQFADDKLKYMEYTLAYLSTFSRF